MLNTATMLLFENWIGLFTGIFVRSSRSNKKLRIELGADRNMVIRLSDYLFGTAIMQVFCTNTEVRLQTNFM